MKMPVFFCVMIMKQKPHRFELPWSTLLGTNISPQKCHFEDDFPFPKVGYVNPLEGNDAGWISHCLELRFAKGSSSRLGHGTLASFSVLFREALEIPTFFGVFFEEMKIL